MNLDLRLLCSSRHSLSSNGSLPLSPLSLNCIGTARVRVRASGFLSLLDLHPTLLDFDFKVDVLLEGGIDLVEGYAELYIEVLLEVRCAVVS